MVSLQEYSLDASMVAHVDWDGVMKDGAHIESRPSKRPYTTQIHIISDDLTIRSRALQHKAPVPPRTSSQRRTWPDIKPAKQPSAFSLVETPMLIRTPWEQERKRRPASQRSRRTNNSHRLPKHVFEQLPPEVYRCVLDQLETLYCVNSTVDVAAYRADLRSCCLTSKRWDCFAKEYLYRDLCLSHFEPSKKRKFTVLRDKSRLEYLTRTLKQQPQLAQLVRRLRVTPSLQLDLDAKCCLFTKAKSSLELLTDVVRLCPELEEVIGFMPELSPHYANYFEALFSRWNLKAHAWIVEPSNWALVDTNWLIRYQSGLHRLETLIFSKTNLEETSGLGAGLVPAMIHKLPSLKHLMIEGLSREDFHNGTLLSLPPLRSLRLDHLPGVTDQGIEQLSTSRLGFSLQSLTLHGLELTSLRTIQSIFTNCIKLRRFRLVQTTSPGSTVGMNGAPWRALLSSKSLMHLHWETLFANSALGSLATSISHGNFPSLRVIKAPCDDDGQLQGVCRPLAQEHLTVEDLEYLEATTSMRYSHSLRLARLQTQLRIKESRQRPSFNVIVQDEEEKVRQTHAIGSFIGRLDSSIEFSLEPDTAGSTQALATLSDIASPRMSCNDTADALQAEQTGRRETVVDYSALF